MTIASAQTVVEGKVTELQSNRALPGCTVLIKNSSKGTITDMSGNFTLREVQTGKISLIVSFVKYKTAEIELELKSNHKYMLEIVMVSSRSKSEQPKYRIKELRQ